MSPLGGGGGCKELNLTALHTFSKFVAFLEIQIADSSHEIS